MQSRVIQVAVGNMERAVRKLHAWPGRDNDTPEFICHYDLRWFDTAVADESPNPSANLVELIAWTFPEQRYWSSEARGPYSNKP